VCFDRFDRNPYLFSPCFIKFVPFLVQLMFFLSRKDSHTTNNFSFPNFLLNES
jgi:hypothetical protein